MKEDIRAYAKIGLVYQLLYPNCVEGADYHAQTLAEFSQRMDIESLDCVLPFGDERRERLIPLMRTCGKGIVYSPHMYPSRKISAASHLQGEQGLTRLIYADQIPLAKAIGAWGMIFFSGIDVPFERREEGKRIFRDFTRWFAGQLKPAGMTALLEPFDREMDKKFLYGPSEECVELLDSLKPEVDNVAIELDMAHVVLMKESFVHAIRTCLPYLAHVHLGNCVTTPGHPWYGDQHPPIGLDGGAIDVPELMEILGQLLEHGYLKKEHRRSLTLEIQPFPNMGVEETVADQMDRLQRAWAQV